MGALKGFADYIIPLRGLKDGDHQFDYSMDDSFFNAFDQDEIIGGSAKAEIKLRKRSLTIELTFTIKGELDVLCDRCLDDMKLKIETNAKLVLKMGERYEELSEELISITEDEMDFDLAPFVFDYIRLEIPLKKIHDEGECNEDMLNKLEEYKAGKEESNDPRWDELKNLLNKN